MSEVKKLRPVSKAELAAKGVSALSDRPNTRKQYGVGGLTAQELKAWFDKLSVFLAEKINEIHDTISEDGASDYIKIDTDDANIATLGDLVRAIYSGYLSERALYVTVPGAAEGTLVQVLRYLNGKISLNAENINTLMSNAGVRISLVTSGNTVTVRLTNSTGKVLAFITLDLTATTDRIADGAVTMPKIAEKSLSTDAFADQSVSTRTIQPKAVTEDKLSAELLLKLASLAGGALSGVSFDPSTNRITVTNAAGQSFSAELVFDSSSIDADPKGTAKQAVSAHNADTSAHADLRKIVSELAQRLSAIADSDDGTLDQLSEIVAYIKNNKNLIENITTSKVSYADIVSDLVTGGEKKALSAAQGVAIKALIDGLDRDKASQAELASELERLLTEAKDSGEFDGESISIVSTQESSGSGGINVVTFSDGSKLNVKNGYTPYIGENGNWYIGNVDTTIKAKGEDGKDGKFVYEELTDEQIMEIRADVNNLIPFPYKDGSVGTTVTKQGVTVIVNQDRSITLNGTATAEAYFMLYSVDNDDGLLSAGETYRLSPILGSGCDLNLYYWDGSGTQKWARDSIKWQNGFQLMQIFIIIRKDSTFDNLTIRPSIRVGGATPIKGTDYWTPEDKAEVKGYMYTELRTSLNNILPFPYSDGSVGETVTNNGITWTVNSDGSVTANGTATARTRFYLVSRAKTKEFSAGSTYRLSGCPEGGSEASYYIRAISLADQTAALATDIGSGITWVQSTTEECFVLIDIESGYTADNITFYPLLTEVSCVLSDEDKAEIADTVRYGSIPDYWQTHLDERVEDIRRAMESAGRNKSAFFFYSDAHWSNETTYTAKLAPALLKYLHAKTPINKTNYGGDIVSAESSDTDTMAYLWDWREQLRDLPNHHSVIGNHDDGNTTNNLFSTEYIYAYLFAPEENNDVVWGGDFYYYIDDKSEKTRYLYLDIFYDGVSSAQLEFAKEAIRSVSEGWHIIAVCHAWFANDYTVYPPLLNGFATETQPFLDMFDDYNARSGEYANCGGSVELCIGGHYHLDHYEHTAGGIPVIIVEADTIHNRSGTMPSKGTTDEAAVSAVVCDYNDRVVKVIRVGRGESYEVPINWTAPVTYTNVIPLSVASDGTPFADGKGWMANSRIGSGGIYAGNQTPGTDAAQWVTGHIAIDPNIDNTIRLKNITFDKTSTNGSHGVFFFDASFANAKPSSSGNATYLPIGTLLANVYMKTEFDGNNIVKFDLKVGTVISNTNIRYFAICCGGLSDDSIITINEAIE